MKYITVFQRPKMHQMTIEELLSPDYIPIHYNNSVYDTYTYSVERVSQRVEAQFPTHKLTDKLINFNIQTQELRNADRQSLYETFHIPKKSGGLRRIDAPKPELMDALRDLKALFENDFRALYHTSAFAYIRGRSTVDAVKRHQNNESKWFAKLDLKDFFGSTSLTFVLDMLSQIFPFSQVIETPGGRDLMRDVISLAFLNGGLPQGTPISPLITNVMMIPIDHALAKSFRDFNRQNFVYTRYADDFIISSRYDFNVKDVESEVNRVLSEFGAPFKINDAKTRYGSSAGRNWNLGLMLNKDNQITVGNKNKRRLKSMIYNFVQDIKKGIEWELHDIQVMSGLISYYRMVEKEVIDAILKYMDTKLNINVEQLIKSRLAA